MDKTTCWFKTVKQSYKSSRNFLYTWIKIVKKKIPSCFVGVLSKKITITIWWFLNWNSAIQCSRWRKQGSRFSCDAPAGKLALLRLSAAAVRRHDRSTKLWRHKRFHSRPSEKNGKLYSFLILVDKKCKQKYCYLYKTLVRLIV